jgi:hypothetical protein
MNVSQPMQPSVRPGSRYPNPDSVVTRDIFAYNYPPTYAPNIEDRLFIPRLSAFWWQSTSPDFKWTSKPPEECFAEGYRQYGNGQDGYLARNRKQGCLVGYESFPNEFRNIHTYLPECDESLGGTMWYENRTDHDWSLYWTANDLLEEWAYKDNKFSVRVTFCIALLT